MDNIDKRLKKFRELLEGKGIDAALVSRREDVIYLSGFTGSSGTLLISQKESRLVTDFRYVEQAAIQTPSYEVVQYRGALTGSLNDLIKKDGYKNIGIEEYYLTLERYEDYKANIQVETLLPMGNLISNLRMVKSTSEIEIIKKAVIIAENAFDHILSYIKPGVKELEIAAELEYSMKKQGAKGASFETIVASGVRSAMPHGTASEKVIEMGDAITMDFGCIYEDYCSDMTRTVFLGNPGEEMRKIYGIVLEAQLKALEGAHRGLAGKEIDGIARKIIAGNGYEKNFGHGLGHGVGLEVHEAPRLSPAGDIMMEDKMVVTVEPGIYIHGLGGVRIEDMIIINSDAPEVLNKASKDIIII